MTEPNSPAHLDREDPEGLLNARTDPGGAALGTMGSEAGSDLNWIMMLRERVQTRAAGSSRYRWWVLCTLLAGLLALNFTFTIFTVDLSTVAVQLHTNVTVLSWTMVGPLLAYGLAAPILGKTGDIFGHRRLYLFGLLGAAVSAILTALSHNVDMLLFARALDGVQGAATGTASGALINMVFSPQERVKALGWWSLIGAGGPVIGVSLGAPIIAVYGWRALFWFQLILIMTAFVVVVIILPRNSGFDHEGAEAKAEARRQFRRMDWLGSWSLSFAVGFLMFGLSIGETWGWTNYRTLGCFVLTVLMTMSFVYRLRRAEYPLIPPHYFRRRNFVMPMVLRACSNFAYFGAFFLFPLLMEKGYGYSVRGVGAISLFRPITFSICSPIAGYITMRIGERVSAFAGAAFLTSSLVLFSFLHPSTSAWFIALALALSGLGMGVAMPASSSAMANEVNQDEFGVMSAAQMLAVQVGEVAGIEVLVTIRQYLVRHDKLSLAKPGPALLNTFHLPFMIGACVAAGGVVAAFCMRAVPREHRKRND